MTSSLPFNPVQVLGCTAEQAMQLFHGRPVTPGEAEAIAQRSYEWRRHVRDADSYWVTVGQAAAILHTSPQEVRRLVAQRVLPCIRQPSGVRLMRRAQVEQVAAWRAPHAATD